MAEEILMGNATPGASGTSGLNRLLTDRNFLSLLAGIGGGLDPQGPAGALGGATRNYIQSVATQEALGQQEKQRSASNLLALVAQLPEGEQKNEYLNRAINMLGGITTKGQPGVTAIKRGQDNQLTVDLDLPGAPAQGAAPAPSGAPELQPPPASGMPTLSTAPRTARRGIASAIPFYYPPGE